MAINLRSLGDAVRMSLRALGRIRAGDHGTSGGAGTQHGRAAARSSPEATVPPDGASAAYAGDFQGVSTARYAPQPDGEPDPGEVVWTWVPYEEDHTRGKDRPVLLIGHNGDYLLGLMLTSKDHDQDRSGGGEYVDLGTGSWDRQGRPSEANLGRILQVSPDNIRREGAILD
nr:type II toxin-antitoxin system PemK/MazF family toxin [Actinomycetota bacterium]